MRLALYFSALLLTACRMMESVPLQTLQPADVCLPTEVRKVGVVYRPCVGARGQEARVADELARRVNEGNYFDQVLILDSALCAGGDEPLLSLAVVQEVTSSLQVDALLSVERVQLDFAREVYALPEDGGLQAELCGRMGIATALYLPARRQPLVVFSDRDSLFWDAWQVDESRLAEAVRHVASLPPKHWLPSWEDHVRLFYTGGCADLRDAAVCVRAADWELARACWLRTYDRKERRLRLRAAYNLALYYEVADDPSQALQWLEKALELASAGQTFDAEGTPVNSGYDYALIAAAYARMKQREVDLQKLKLQMQRFADDF